MNISANLGRSFLSKEINPEAPYPPNHVFLTILHFFFRIAKQIVDDAIDDVERSINFGEETFVRDFIQMELES